MGERAVKAAVRRLPYRGCALGFADAPLQRQYVPARLLQPRDRRGARPASDGEGQREIGRRGQRRRLVQAQEMMERNAVLHILMNVARVARVAALTFDHVVQDRELLRRIRRRLFQRLVHHRQLLARPLGPARSESIDAIQVFAEGRLVIAPQRCFGLHQPRTQVVRLRCQDAFHQLLDFGVVLRTARFVQHVGQRKDRRQIERALFDRLAQMSQRRLRAALPPGELAQVGFDFTAIGRQLVGPLQIAGGLVQLIVAQIEQAAIRPSRRFFGNQLDRSIEIRPCVVQCFRRVERRRADAEITQVFGVAPTPASASGTKNTPRSRRPQAPRPGPAPRGNGVARTWWSFLFV